MSDDAFDLLLAVALCAGLMVAFYAVMYMMVAY